MYAVQAVFAVLVVTAENVQLIVTLLLPVAVAVVTKKVASNGLKAVLLIVLTGVSELIAQSVVDDGSAIISMATFREWVLATAIAIATYVGFWQPVAQINDRLFPSFGLGKAA